MDYNKRFNVRIPSLNKTVTVNISTNKLYSEDAELYYYSFLYPEKIYGADYHQKIDELRQNILSLLTIECEDNTLLPFLESEVFSKATGFLILQELLKDIITEKEKYSINNVDDLFELVEYYYQKGISLNDAYDLFVMLHTDMNGYLQYKKADNKTKANIIVNYQRLYGVDVKTRFERHLKGIEPLNLVSNETDPKYTRTTNDRIQQLINNGAITEEEAENLHSINWDVHKKMIEIAKQTNNNGNDWSNDPILGPNSRW